MSEYCERCVHTDAEIQRLTRERDEARKLAYIGEHHFPDLTWKVRCAEAAADIASLRAQVAQMQTRMSWLEDVVAAAKGSAKDLKWVAGQLRHAYAQPNQDKGIADGLLSPQIKRLERFNDTIDVLLAKEPTGDPDAKSA